MSTKTWLDELPAEVAQTLRLSMLTHGRWLAECKAKASGPQDDYWQSNIDKLLAAVEASGGQHMQAAVSDQINDTIKRMQPEAPKA